MAGTPDWHDDLLDIELVNGFFEDLPFGDVDVDVEVDADAQLSAESPSTSARSAIGASAQHEQQLPAGIDNVLRDIFEQSDFLNEVAQRVASLKPRHTGDLPSLAAALAELYPSYHVYVRETRKRNGSVSQCLKRLHHAHIILCPPHSALAPPTRTSPIPLGKPTLVVEPAFRDNLCINSPSTRYQAIQDRLPEVFVAYAADFAATIDFIAEEMAASFRSQSQELPPWRTRQALASKWDPSLAHDTSVNTPIVDPSRPLAPVAAHPTPCPARPKPTLPVASPPARSSTTAPPTPTPKQPCLPPATPDPSPRNPIPHPDTPQACRRGAAPPKPRSTAIPIPVPSRALPWRLPPSLAKLLPDTPPQALPPLPPPPPAPAAPPANPPPQSPLSLPHVALLPTPLAAPPSTYATPPPAPKKATASSACTTPPLPTTTPTLPSTCSADSPPPSTPQPCSARSSQPPHPLSLHPSALLSSSSHPTQPPATAPTAITTTTTTTTTTTRVIKRGSRTTRTVTTVTTTTQAQPPSTTIAAAAAAGVLAGLLAARNLASAADRNTTRLPAVSTVVQPAGAPDVAAGVAAAAGSSAVTAAEAQGIPGEPAAVRGQRSCTAEPPACPPASPAAAASAAGPSASAAAAAAAAPGAAAETAGMAAAAAHRRSLAPKAPFDAAPAAKPTTAALPRPPSLVSLSAAASSGQPAAPAAAIGTTVPAWQTLLTPLPVGDPTPATLPPGKAAAAVPRHPSLLAVAALGGAGCKAGGPRCSALAKAMAQPHPPPCMPCAPASAGPRLVSKGALSLKGAAAYRP